MDQIQRIPLSALGELFAAQAEPAGSSAPPAAPQPGADQAAALRAMASQPPLRLAGEAPALPADQPRAHRWRDRRPGLDAAMPTAMQAVFLGNLPGFASPWLNQYAHRLAREHQQPTLILHFDAQHVDVRAVGDPPGVAALGQRLEQLRSQTHGDDTLALIELLACLDHPAPLAGCLLHVPPGLPQGMKLARQVGTWTLLTGRDEPAVAAAGQWLEHLLAGAFEDAQAAGQVRVGVMVMGADAGCDEPIVQRLEQTAAGRLAEPVISLGTQKRMLPVHVQTLGRIQANSQQQLRLLEMLAAPGPSPLDDAVSKPDLPDESQTPGNPSAGPDLIAWAGKHANLSGLTALTVRCPRQSSVVLAVDGAGCLHLLSQHQGQADDLRAALIGLFDARQWVCQHAAILQQLVSHLDPQADPTLHLFSDHARQAAALIPAVQQWVRLYLLAPVQVADQAAWYCSPLN